MQVTSIFSPMRNLSKRILGVASFQKCQEDPRSGQRDQQNGVEPMPAFISNDLKACIPVLCYEQGFSLKKICQILNIKKTLAYQCLQSHCLHGLAHGGPHVGQGLRWCVLSTPDLSFIQMPLNQQHTVYLDEIQEQLLLCCGVTVSLPTLTHTLCQLHFMHQDICGRALECNNHLCAIYMNCIADLMPDPEMLMFSDEAHKDERTLKRQMGWSCQGTKCVQRKCFVQGRRFSILPILTLDGIIVHDIVEGSITSKRFVEFLRELVVCP